MHLCLSVTNLSEIHTHQREEKRREENVAREIEDDVQGEKERGQISVV